MHHKQKDNNTMDCEGKGNKSKMTICSICQSGDAAGPEDEFCSLSQCGHKVCAPCIESWILLVERTVSGPGPSCPWCRRCLQDEEILMFLGRPFKRKTLGDVMREAEKMKRKRDAAKLKRMIRRRQQSRSSDGNEKEDSTVDGTEKKNDRPKDKSCSDNMGNVGDPGVEEGGRAANRTPALSSLIASAFLIALGAVLFCYGRNEREL